MILEPQKTVDVIANSIFYSLYALKTYHSYTHRNDVIQCKGNFPFQYRSDRKTRSLLFHSEIVRLFPTFPSQPLNVHVQAMSNGFDISMDMPLNDVWVCLFGRRG